MSGGRSTPPARAAAGLTLLELLLVMGLLGLLLGTGLGVFATRDTLEPIAPSIARSALRSAAGTARAERAPVSLLWDAQAATLAILAPQTIGTWHFESAMTDKRLEGFADGAPSRRRSSSTIAGVLRGGEWIEPAWIGTGLDLAAGRGAATYSLALHQERGFEFDRGFALQVVMHPTEPFDGVVWRLGALAGLDYRADGGLEARITLRADGDPTGRRLGGQVVTALPPGTVPVGRWTRVEVLFDGVELRVTVDDFPAAIVPVPETPLLPRLDGPLVLGDGRKAFVGWLDALSLRTYTSGEPLVLPEGEPWPADAPTRVRFDADGTLDRRLHPKLLELQFTTAPGQVERVRVSRYGTVE